MPFQQGESGNPSTQFKKGESGNPKGRPRKLTSKILDTLKSEGFEVVSASNVREACLLLVGMSEDKLRELESDEDTPQLFRLVARGLLSRRGFEILEKILDRTFGKTIVSEQPDESKRLEIVFIDAWDEDEGLPTDDNYTQEY